MILVQYLPEIALITLIAVTVVTFVYMVYSMYNGAEDKMLFSIFVLMLPIVIGAGIQANMTERFDHFSDAEDFAEDAPFSEIVIDFDEVEERILRQFDADTLTYLHETPYLQTEDDIVVMQVTKDNETYLGELFLEYDVLTVNLYNTENAETITL